MAKAYSMAVTPRNNMAGFNSTGIFPLNRNISTDEDFLASVTDRPAADIAENRVNPTLHFANVEDASTSLVEEYLDDQSHHAILHDDSSAFGSPTKAVCQTSAPTLPVHQLLLFVRPVLPFRPIHQLRPVSPKLPVHQRKVFDRPELPFRPIHQLKWIFRLVLPMCQFHQQKWFVKPVLELLQYLQSLCSSPLHLLKTKYVKDIFRRTNYFHFHKLIHENLTLKT